MPNDHNVWMLCVHSTKQSVMVQNLLPNTRYEFVVRLHVDQMSSTWSSVVYHMTPPAGNKLNITVTTFCHDYVAVCVPRQLLCHANSNRILAYPSSISFSASVVYHECHFPVCSTQPATCWSASNSDRGWHCSGVVEGAHRAQCSGYTLHHHVRFTESLDGRTLADTAEGGWVVHWIMLSVKSVMQMNPLSPQVVVGCLAPERSSFRCSRHRGL